MTDALRAPFSYFGGKSAVTDLVWPALGQPKSYIEPFFGSGAVLLSRPGYVAGEHIETVNDKDGHLANVWRALQHDPDAVARVCDWPVNHADLSARKTAMIAHENDLLARLVADPEYYDAKLAGYWIWAASCWIGSGLTDPTDTKRPHISTGGKGVHAIGQVPHISTGGMGVHALGKVPHISDGGKGVQEPYNTNIYRWFRTLSERLRYVRVVCGDWTRVCGGEWQEKSGTVGIFFDPPYGVEDRYDVYSKDSKSVAADVRAWCLERGSRPSYRIVLAGYEEHAELLSHGWTATRWKANGGYSIGTNENCKRETLYLSPHCVGQRSMFAEAETTIPVDNSPAVR